MGKVELLRALDNEGGNTFFSFLFGNSPYLTRLILRDTEFAEALVLQHPDTLAARVTAGLSEADPAMNRDRLMRLLRKQRSRVTILAAVLDCFGIRDVMACAGMLASMADQAVRLAAEHLLLDRVARGELGEPEGDAGARRWGYFVLAAGRHGARELSYSSDVSLMAVYDPESIRYTGLRSLRDCFVRVTRDLARILQARTRDGYVFRTDLRLRPDAAAAPPAVSEDFALRYYRNSGRTWERAVLVTARPVAGDQVAAADFLKRLGPFIWEEGLNFASVEDIRSMNRQIHDFHRRRGTLRGRGLDLELGRGGIREAEFFVLMHQLAYGGRSRRLRGSGVIPMLETLEREGHLLPREAGNLRDAYLQLHRIEHRVQLVNDGLPGRFPRRAGDSTTSPASWAWNRERRSLAWRKGPWTRYMHSSARVSRYPRVNVIWRRMCWTGPPRKPRMFSWPKAFASRTKPSRFSGDGPPADMLRPRRRGPGPPFAR